MFFQVQVDSGSFYFVFVVEGEGIGTVSLETSRLLTRMGYSGYTLTISAIAPRRE